jgi:NAD(P)-dependent dehydrogenase (short-subunit alcohol dehydrogenase family)
MNGFEDLQGKTAAMTGGAGIIGGAFCRAMCSAGIRLAILDLDGERARKMAEEIASDTGGLCIGVTANVLDRASLETAKADIHARFGPVDFLINGAGGNHPSATTAVEQISHADLGDLSKTFFGLDPDGFDRVFALNFKGTVIPTIVFAQDMTSRGGAIVNISSMNSYRPLTRIPAYSAAKAAVNNFTQWLAVHLARLNIRVNAIAPGFFLTDQNRSLLTKPDGSFTPRAETILKHTPMRRFGNPDDLLGTLLWLVDDQASGFITGTIIPVDGGFSAFSGV